MVGIRRLFGGHVVAGAHHLARAGQAVLVGFVGQSGDACQAHVEDLDRAFLVQQQVAGLDVAVDDVAFVGILEPAGGLQDVLDGLRHRQRSLLLDQGRQVLALHVFHDQVMDAPMLAGVVGLHDVGMIEFRGGFHLAVETLDGIDRSDFFSGDHLHRHQSLHAAVFGLEDHAHSALAQFVQDKVVAEDQPLGLALIDQLGLILGQLALANKGLGELLAILGPLFGRKALLEGSDLRGGHQPAPGELLGELLQADGHGFVSGGPEGDYHTTES